MFDSQEGKCKICGLEEVILGRRLAVDHCHITDKIRGLLCFRCNTGLGNFKDDPTLIKKALDYVNDIKDYTIATNWAYTH